MTTERLGNGNVKCPNAHCLLFGIAGYNRLHQSLIFLYRKKALVEKKLDSLKCSKFLCGENFPERMSDKFDVY